MPIPNGDMDSAYGFDNPEIDGCVNITNSVVDLASARFNEVRNPFGSKSGIVNCVTAACRHLCSTLGLLFHAMAADA